MTTEIASFPLPAPETATPRPDSPHGDRAHPSVRFDCHQYSARLHSDSQAAGHLAGGDRSGTDRYHPG